MRSSRLPALVIALLAPGTTMCGASSPALAPTSAAASEARPERADPPGSPEHTTIDHDDVAFTLPGRWREQRTDDGYEWWRGKEEQIIVGVYPPMNGLDAPLRPKSSPAFSGTRSQDSARAKVRWGSSNGSIALPF